MAVHALDEAYSATAEWFLPDRPEHTITGTLNYAQGQITLDLLDTFSPLEGAVYGNETINYSRICGRSRTGTLFTLINPLRIGTSISFGQAGIVQPDRVTASMLIIGAVTEDDPALSHLVCRVPGLAVWLSRPIVEMLPETRSDPTSLAFRVARLPPETFRIPALSADLVFEVASTTSPGPYSFNVATMGSWSLIPDLPQPLSWYLRQMCAITAFLSLCAGVTMPADCITIPSEGHRDRSSLLLRQTGNKYCTVTHQTTFFLAREAFAAQFGQYLANWFDLYPRFETTNALAMSILASDQLWPHVEFLSLMQALEGFHRVRHDGLYMAKKEYTAVADALIEAIPASVGSDHRSSLKSRIQYGNEVSLARRLACLCAALSEPVCGMLFGDSRKLPRRWIDTRNYYTHWDDALREQILDGQSLIYAIARLRSLLRVLYLDAIGVPQEIISQALTGVSADAQGLIHILGVERRAADPSDRTGAFMFIQRRASAPAGTEQSDFKAGPETDTDFNVTQLHSTASRLGAGIASQVTDPGTGTGERDETHS